MRSVGTGRQTSKTGGGAWTYTVPSAVESRFQAHSMDEDEDDSACSVFGVYSKINRKLNSTCSYAS